MSAQEITTSLVTDTTESSGVATSENNNEFGTTQQANIIPTTCNSLIPLEDCKCPICLDYFIDVVETRCNHRFCHFCLENWLHVSIHRQCPTCRSTIQGTIQAKPELQEIIDASISQVLRENEVRERLQVRSERQTQVERFSADREQTQALLARITSSSSSRPRTRQVRRGRRFPEHEHGTREPGSSFLSRHIMNWWDDNNVIGAEESPPVRGPTDQPNPPEQPDELENLPLDWYRHLRALNEYENSFESSSAPPPDVINRQNWSMAGPSSNARNNQRANRRSVPSHFDQSYHENLMEEYSYHLRRVNSAHTRIREAYRDFNYHNGRMQEILREHRSFFSSMRTSTDTVPNENHVVSYEDYEDLGLTELGDLLDNSPAAQVVFGRFPPENNFGHASHNNMRNGVRENFTLERGADNMNARRSTQNSRRYARFPTDYESTSLAHRTNVLDMENEIRNRRSQLNHLSTFIRQCPWNSDSGYSRASSSGPSTSNRMTRLSAAHLAPPDRLTEPELRGISDFSSLPNPDQHRVMVEQLTGRSNNGACPRRMRRRLARTNIFRTSVNDGESESTHVQNVSNENAPVLPVVIPLGDVDNMSRANSGPTAASIQNLPTIPNVEPTPSPPDREGHLLPTSAGWIMNMNNNMNDSSESDYDERTRRDVPRRRVRTNSISPHGLSRPMSVPPRQQLTGFRRVLRLNRRRFNVSNNNADNDATSATAPASSSSTTNLSTTMDEHTDALSTLANNATDTAFSDEGAFNRAADTSETDDIVTDSIANHNSERSISANDDTAADNENNSIDSAMQDITSMSNYLKNICDQFRTR